MPVWRRLLARIISIFPFRTPLRRGAGLLLLFFCLLFPLERLWAQDLVQEIGFKLLNGRKEVEIPFQEVSNLIVVPVIVENMLPLQFILDTGVRTAILTDRVYGDLLNMNYIRKYTIRGAGNYQVVEAYVVSDVSFNLPQIEAKNLSLLVLEEDYLELGQQLGVKVDGILGYEFFSSFVVKVDYENDLLTIYDPNHFKARKSFSRMELKVEDTKPYIVCHVQEKPGGKKKPVSLMIDTGASHALLLHQDDGNERFNLPDKTIFGNLGRGLGGEIFGHIGRIHGLQLKDFNFQEVLVSFPQDSAYGNISEWNDRGGTIGGNLLNRFEVIFDYPGNAVYFRKGDRFKDPFVFNKTGLTLSAQGPDLNSFKVQEVQKDSPAFAAGIAVGDELLRINGFWARRLSLSRILEIFGRGDGKKIKVLMLRDGVEYKTSFRLRDII